MEPHTRKPKRKRLEVHPGPLPGFDIPTNHRLLITTSSNVYSISQSGLKVHFKSQYGAIISAKQAAGSKDGLLAVATGYGVILHQTGDPDRLCQLHPADGQLGLLAFMDDYKNLLYTTAMQTSLRLFDIEKNEFLDCNCIHPSPPTALAVSCDSTYVVSASAFPPVVYLQTSSLKIDFQPRQSSDPVTVIAFHPEKHELFLLGFRDGTLSVHTASRILLMRATGSDGCLGHLKGVAQMTTAHSKQTGQRFERHSSGSIGDRSVGVTASEFIKGYKLRVVSVSGDGKCKIIDFERGPNIIRSWSVHTACTSLAVLTFEKKKSFIIAVGQIDGLILFFDAAGLLRRIQKVSEAPLELAWVSELDQSILQLIPVANEVQASKVYKTRGEASLNMSRMPGSWEESSSSFENLVDNLQRRSSSKLRRTPSRLLVENQAKDTTLQSCLSQIPAQSSIEPVDSHKMPAGHYLREYDCIAVIRQEMALVRAEIAALRRGLWVLGSRIDNGGLVLKEPKG